ncbi:hypothetical protein ACVWYN_002207 [Pedobacter sp. UYP24]
MYKEVKTKKEYRDLMEYMLTETGSLIVRFPQIGIYKSIFDQLQDIKKTIIVEKKELDEDETDERYNLGGMISKNFNSETELYARKLEDLFGAASEYYKLPTE